MFKLANWGRASASRNEPLVTLQSNVITGSFRSYNYYAQGAPDGDGDTQATIATANYFNPVNYEIETGDVIFAESAEDGTVATYLATNTDGNITVTAFNFADGSIGTVNIINGAVTYPKMQNVTAEMLLGNPTGVDAIPSEISLGNGLTFSGTTLDIRNEYLTFASGTISALEFRGMYGAPIALIGNPGANKAILIEQLLLDFTAGDTQYTAGGAVIAQYGNTVHGGGVNACSATIASATINALNADSALTLNNFTGPTATATAINAGVYLSNQTAAFATGDGTFNWYAWFRVVNAL